MNSFRFISKIKSIFSKASEQPISNTKSQVLADAALVSVPKIDNDQPIAIENPSSLLVKQVQVMPPATNNALPKSLRPELPASDDNSLENHGLSSCGSSNGDVEMLKSRLNIVAKNYTIEAYLNQEDTRSVYAQNIDQTNYKIIELNIKISNIQNEQIPEQNIAIVEYEQQILAIQAQALQNDTVLPQSYTIMQLAVANTKEGISKLKQKTQAYKSEIEQKKYYIDSLNKKMKEINMINPDIQLRRMNIFFSGWVKGLRGLGWTDEQIRIQKQTFNDFENNHHYMGSSKTIMDTTNLN